MRGADLVIETLLQAEVDTVFTLSGNQIMPLFDACIGKDIQLIHVRHEAAAVYMADAWAQLSSHLGVALVTAAPGFANCLTALYTARACDSPVLLLSGDSPTVQDGRGAFQELNQTAISATIAKYAHRCLDAAALGCDVAKAIQIARSGRPGPVHLALPYDMLNEEPDDVKPVGEDAFSSAFIAPEAVHTMPVLQLLSSASRPIVLTGPQLITTRAGDVINRLATGLCAPVVPMESPRGLKDPMLGDFAQMLVRADLVVFLGKRVDFSVNFGKSPAFNADCKFAVIDAETEALDQARQNLGARLTTAIQADANAAAEALTRRGTGQPDRLEWRQDVADAIASRLSEQRQSSLSGNRIHPSALCQAVQRVLEEDSILICDGGEFGQWTQACLSASTRLINGIGGAIGGILCYGIAAKLYRPQATVIALMGDGTAGFHLSEFDTAVRYGIPFIAIIGNDARWNAEHQIQLRDYGPGRLIGCELLATRYDLAVIGLGGYGEYVTDLLELDGAIERASNSGLPACINVEIEGLPAPAGAGH